MGRGSSNVLYAPASAITSGSRKGGVVAYSELPKWLRAWQEALEWRMPGSGSESKKITRLLLRLPNRIKEADLLALRRKVVFQRLDDIQEMLCQHPNVTVNPQLEDYLAEFMDLKSKVHGKKALFKEQDATEAFVVEAYQLEEKLDKHHRKTGSPVSELLQQSVKAMLSESAKHQFSSPFSTLEQSAKDVGDLAVNADAQEIAIQTMYEREARYLVTALEDLVGRR